MTINKEAIMSTIKRISAMYVAYFIIATSVKDYFTATMPLGAFMWDVLWALATFFFILLPLWEQVKKEKPYDPRAFILASEEEAKKRKIAEDARPKVSAETNTLRVKRLPDIRCCLSDTAWDWKWADTSTVSRLYLYTREKTVHASIHIDVKDRLDYIEAVIDGHVEKFINAPYVEARRAEAAILDKPVQCFMAGAIPDASWLWENYDEQVIRMSSKTRKLNNILAKLKVQPDGSISSILVTLRNGKTQRIYAKKVSASKVERSKVSTARTERPQSAVEPLSGTVTAEPAKTDSVASETAQRGVSEMPAGAPPAPAEGKDAEGPLLNPTDVPDLPQSVIEANAKNIAEYMAQGLEEMACRVADGERYVVIPWPEGMQTVTEVAALGEILVANNGFLSFEVDAKTKMLSLEVPAQEEDCDFDQEDFPEND